MIRQQKTRIFRGISCMALLLALSLALAGCGDDGGSYPEDVRIYAFVDQPVSGAHVQAMDIGETHGWVQTSTATTSDTGASIVTFNGQPLLLDVMVEGGTTGDLKTPFEGLLRGRFLLANDQNRILYVNAVTTIVCAYMDLTPGASLQVAEKTIKDFLEIPQGVDIGEDLYLSDQDFSHFEFMKAAGQNGGFDAFIQELLTELSQDPSATHKFPKVSLMVTPPGTLLQCPGTTMAQAARNGLVAWGVGFAMNVAFDQMGLSGVFGDKSHQQIMDTLNEMKNTLRNIQGQLYDLKGQINDVKSEIIAAIDAVQYGQAIGNIVDYETLILNTFNGLKNELDLDPATLSESQRNARLGNIRYYMNVVSTSIFPYRGSLHKKLYGFSGTEGALSLYAKQVNNRYRYVTKDTARIVQKVFEYYNMIEAMEIELCVEYARASAMAVLTIDGVINTGESDSQKELNWFNLAAPLPYQCIYDTQSGLMLYRPDNYGASMYSWPQPVCPSEDQGYDAWIQCMDTKVFCYVWENVYYANKYTPWQDWRLPTYAELQAVFNGWSPGYRSPAVYAEVKGWPDMTQYSEPYGLSTGEACGADRGYIYRLNNGSKFCDWTGSHWPYPARVPLAGERYWW